MRRKGYLSASVLIFTIVLAGLFGYTQNPSDAIARVPALDAFHEVIFKIWHEAWPNKNIAMLRQLLPEVESGIAKVASAQLPGILREKREAWEEGIKKLQTAGSEYKAAAEANDESRLLSAAEVLHSRFEGLMRAIRPALKELDDFHAVLYMLYHQYLPNYDLEKIRLSATELKQKMTALNGARLPERLKDKASEFQAARAKLSASVEALENSVRSDEKKLITDAVETMHSDYQDLNRIFE
jgi:hypothetical protein